ncbi:phosphoribosylglycinamide formyltransferase [Leucobacter weissii]|uniref:Phosphoribosylglycinamide formyltransferase n=1 Tax=Leucobacter weissii TaxID=1983706 RepID=A0A939MNQ9_9MICO|nr:phosphoribosylglycinamide formyltransferase [Leucobacter weissii]MBO1902177.1 phosphoribosylglycinamide formyltransferase [Leucobacter weissii]
MLDVVVLISGSGSNLRALLDATRDPAYPVRIVGVGSDTDAPGLRHAQEAGVPVFVVRPRDFDRREAWGEALAAAIRAHGVSGGPGPVDRTGLVVSAGLMRILPAGFVAAFSPHLINTHPALLPSFPGARAVRDALAAGARETGVSVHVIDEGVDTGPVLRRARVEIRPGESEPELHERIKQLERPLLVDTVRRIAEGELVLDATGPSVS